MTIHAMRTGLCLHLTPDDLASCGLAIPVTAEEAIHLTQVICCLAGVPAMGPIELEVYQGSEGLLLFARPRPGANYVRRPWHGPYPRRRPIHF